MQTIQQSDSKYFWYGVLGLVSIAVLIVPGLIGVNPNASGFAATFRDLYSWAIIIIFWGWIMYVLFINRKSIIKEIGLGSPLSELCYVGILILIIYIFFNPSTRHYIATNILTP